MPLLRPCNSSSFSLFYHLSTSTHFCPLVYISTRFSCCGLTHELTLWCHGYLHIFKLICCDKVTAYLDSHSTTLLLTSLLRAPPSPANQGYSLELNTTSWCTMMVYHDSPAGPYGVGIQGGRRRPQATHPVGRPPWRWP
jgi:hypothetical protein